MNKHKEERIENPQEKVFASVLDEVVRQGAQKMLETAIEV